MALKKPSFYHTRKNICNQEVAANVLIKGQNPRTPPPLSFLCM